MNPPIFLTGLKTPNPQAIKFSVENVMLTEGAWNFASAAQAKISPLAQKLFEFEFVSQVFISQDFVTVNKNPGTADWDELLPQVRAVIKEHLDKREPLVPDEKEKSANGGSSGIDAALTKLMDERVRPATRQDGGDMTIESLENGVLKLKLAGACVKCPYAPRTIKAGVEALVKQSFPEISEVTCDGVDWNETAV